jgi:hypothetical protein
MRILPLAVMCLLSTACGRTELVDYSYLPYDSIRDGGAPDAGRELVPCMTGELTPQPAVPAVMLVVDRSGSMNFDFAGNAGGLFGNPLTGPRRWNVLRTTLEATLSQVDDQVAFGMVQFPGDNSCGVSSSIELLPKAGNAAEVMSRFNRTPSGGTPTFEAVMAAGDQLASVKGQVLVLITDGDPNCNAELDPTTCDCTSPLVGFPPECVEADSCRDAERTADGLRTLRQDRGIITYVVGVGSNNNSVLQALDNMAIAGGAPRMGSARSFYNGATESELSEALNLISTRLTRCTWATGTRLGPDDLVEVNVGGQFVPQGPAGWDWIDATSGELSLKGMWCERAAAGEAVLVKLQCK